MASLIDLRVANRSIRVFPNFYDSGLSLKQGDLAEGRQEGRVSTETARLRRDRRESRTMSPIRIKKEKRAE